MVIKTSDRLTRLRSQMKSHQVDVFLVPSEDAHQSEYIAECDQRRHWISGFTGSAGFAVVTMSTAALFTDGRYFLQASQQLDDNWTLMKQGLPGVPTWQEYLVKNISAGSRIGLDPKLICGADAHQISAQLKPIGSSLVPIQENLVDAAWGEERPKAPKDKIFVQPIQYSGKAVQDKLKELRDHIVEKKAYGTVVSALDEIAWLYNVRGSDIECNPVFFSYSVVTESEAILYIDLDKVTDEVKAHLDASQVTLRPYSEFFEALSEIKLKLGEKKLLVNNKTSLAVEVAVGEVNRHNTFFYLLCFY